MDRLKYFRIIAFAAVAALAFTATAMAENVADLQDRRAQLLKELEAIDAKLGAKGVATSRNLARAHSGGGSGLLYSANVEIGAGWLFTDASEDADSSLDDSDFAVIEGAARASIPLASNWSTTVGSANWGYASVSTLFPGGPSV